MRIIIDTREKDRAIEKIKETFDNKEINYIEDKIFAGDYFNLDNPHVIVDRKHDCGEICGNICGKQHARFAKELKLAKKMKCHMVVLIEDDRISCFEDIKGWSSPNTKVKGETLYKAMKTMETEILTEKIILGQDEKGKDVVEIVPVLDENGNPILKYDVEFRFCKRAETAEQILKILQEAA